MVRLSSDSVLELTLVDSTGAVDVNINDELVRLDLAKHTVETTVKYNST